jgi:hypothetical protein
MEAKSEFGKSTIIGDKDPQRFEGAGERVTISLPIGIDEKSEIPKDYIVWRSKEHPGFNEYTEVLSEGIERDPIVLYHRRNKLISLRNFHETDIIKGPSKQTVIKIGAIATGALASIATGFLIVRARSKK